MTFTDFHLLVDGEQLTTIDMDAKPHLCQWCKHWVKGDEVELGYCANDDVNDLDSKSGVFMTTRLCTQPNFGCIHWEQK